MDLFTFENQDYLILIDYYSDFWEIDMLGAIRSAAIIKACKRHFPRHGIPTTVLTDNGPQFASEEFRNFAKDWGFDIPVKSPYNPQSNGKAESAVKIC